MNREETVLAAMAREAEALPGHLGFYYKNLATGTEYSYHGEEAFLAASVIKLPLLLYTLREAAEGRVSLEERILIREEEKMPGCGALSQLSGPVEVDIGSLCRLMTVISDNTATNAIIRRWGIPALNESFREWGLRQTVLRRYLFDSEAAGRGLENTISPREMGALLERLYRGQFHSPEVSRQALDLLLQQQINHKLDGKLQGAVPIAHKTGEDENLSNDVGIVFAREPFILCFSGHDTDCYTWEDLMRRSAWDLAECQKP